jgi:nucleolar protein 58
MASNDLAQMTRGLSHSLGRYKLKFSPDKVDVMIVQAIGMTHSIVQFLFIFPYFPDFPNFLFCFLLFSFIQSFCLVVPRDCIFSYRGLMDDLDKEINNYAMRVKEWYGWHFPELARLVSDNVQYARICKLLRQRSNIKTVDLSEILDEETEKIVTNAAALSMGTDVTDEDIMHLVELADQVIELFHYRRVFLSLSKHLVSLSFLRFLLFSFRREELGEYIKNRMFAIAPNLTVLVGELVGARLIAHAGYVHISFF